MSAPKISSFPPEVQDVLFNLSEMDFKDLAIQAHIKRGRDDHDAMPTDPREAINAIFDVFKPNNTEIGETCAEMLVNTLAVLRMVLSAGESTGQGIDEADCYPLWELCDRAHDMALVAKAQRFRAMEHCRRVIFEK